MVTKAQRLGYVYDDSDEEWHKYKNEIPTGSNEAFFSIREKRGFKIHAADIHIPPSLPRGGPFNFWGEGRGGVVGGGVISGQQEFFFLQTFFTLLIFLQEFFSLKKGQSKFL